MRIALILPLALLACGPIPVDRAERECAQRARMAEKPEATVFIGVNDQGEVMKGASFSVTTDYLKGRDPAAVFTECVKQRSGQFPTRSYTDISR